MDIYRIAFIGQNKIQGQLRLIKEIEDVIREKLHGKAFVELYAERDSDFGFLAALAVKGAQKESANHNSRLILLQPFPMEDDVYYDRLYDDIQYLMHEKIDPIAAITKRNQWMVDHADLLVAYVEPDRKGSALTTLKYAEKKGVEIINLATQEQ